MNSAFPVEAIRPPNHTHTPGRRRFGQERRPPPRRKHTPPWTHTTARAPKRPFTNTHFCIFQQLSNPNCANTISCRVDELMMLS